MGIVAEFTVVDAAVEGRRLPLRAARWWGCQIVCVSGSGLVP
jgi:hypothetical protein